MAEQVLHVVCFSLVWLFFASPSSAHRGCTDIQSGYLPNNLKLTQNDGFVAFCFIDGHNSSVRHAWGSIQVTFDLNMTNVKLIKADSCDALNQIQNQTLLSQLGSWLLDTVSLKHKVLQLNPFKTSCIRVQAPESPINIHVEFQWLHWQFPVAFVGGLLLFHKADKLSRNAFFFYSSGVTLGLLGGLLILVIILHRLIPQRFSANLFLVGGLSGVMFLVRYTMDNIYDLLMWNNQIIICYFLVAGAISFAICYYYGPITSDRGLDLIRWTLQLCGLSLLYMGTQSEEISIAVVLFVLSLHVLRNSGIIHTILRVFPNRWIPYRLYYVFNRPRLEFLTEDEYVIQGKEETRKALDELREYCSSPECDTWQVVSRLQTPTRFANFISHGEHFTGDEVRRYEDESSMLITDDEGESDDTDQVNSR